MRTSSLTLLASFGVLAAASAAATQSYVRQTSSTTAPVERVTGRLDERNAGTGGVCDAEVVQRSGYFQIDAPNKTNEHYFYWMFESRAVDPADAPFILWLTGGPGCSGMLALLNENGPCTIGPDLVPVNNTLSWTNGANVLWLDQPTGVGFSYGDSGDYDHDEKGVRDDVYHFLLAFFEAHPQYKDNDFFVFGESYGGHYAPNVAYRILQGNEAGEGAHIALAGLAVGNGLTDPATQYPWYPTMAMNNTYGIKTVTEAAYTAMVAAVPPCVALIDACQSDVSKCAEAQASCNNAMLGPYEEAGLNPYDVRLPCEVPGLCYNFSAPTAWLDLPATRAALGVTSASSKWSSCNMKVNSMFANDWMAAQQYTVPPLLAAGVRVLIYAGDADFVCNWMGNKAWTKALAWPSHAAFNAATDHDWTNSAGEKAGTARHAAGLTFLQVNEAGHMVPMDVPRNALEMVQTFTSGGSF